jgi:hypothetical protein
MDVAAHIMINTRMFLNGTVCTRLSIAGAAIAFVVMACGDDPPVAGASTPREP